MKIESKTFASGYLKLSVPDEAELFLSVTPGFEYGPGIERDGVTEPRMTDPRSVDHVCDTLDEPVRHGLPPITDPNLQRLGTWSVHRHLQRFVDANPNWRVLALQTNGDLTMNPWHVAYLGESHLDKQKPGTLCGLITCGSSEEPFDRRVYRCLVKWKDDAVDHNHSRRYEFVSLRFRIDEDGIKVLIVDQDYDAGWLEKGLNRDSSDDIADLIAFALAGKDIVKQRYPIPLQRAVDKFDDVRHVLNLPVGMQVCAGGQFQGIQVGKLNFGEYQLYNNLNERRAALHGPVLVDLDIEDPRGQVQVDHDVAVGHLEASMRSHRNRGQPSHPDHFRTYPDDASKLEVYFAHAVYPFGVFGIGKVDDSPNKRQVVAFSSAGLSGRVGYTLEGVTHMMYHFLKCDDAIVLDEGMDCCLLVNPVRDGAVTYTNEQLLGKTRELTRRLVDAERRKKDGTDLTSDGFNKQLAEDISDQGASSSPAGMGPWDDVFVTKPSRPQVRSVIIYATREDR